MLTSREDGAVLASETADLPRIAGLHEGEWRRVRMEAGELPALDLDEWAGAIVCGSPFDASGDPAGKTEAQTRAEAWLRALYDRALDESFPLLGICYGLGTLALHLGGTVDTAHGEEISGIALRRTAASAGDPLLEGVPERFSAYVGHHEAVSAPAPGMTLLVEGEAAPVQMVRIGEAAWATQFYPELDLAGVEVRIDEYGGRYYPVEKAEEIRRQVRGVDVSPAHLVLRNFVALHRR